MTVRLAVLACVGLALAVAGCSPVEPPPNPARRVWRGPDQQVFSQGIVTYSRRELAQRVPFPACILVGDAVYTYNTVEPQRGSDLVPAGFSNSGYSLDRWRLLTRLGEAPGRDAVFVSVAGSTGILGTYTRQPAGSGC